LPLTAFSPSPSSPTSARSHIGSRQQPFRVWTSNGRLDVGGIVTDIAQSVRGRARGEAEQRSIGEAI